MTSMALPSIRNRLLYALPASDYARISRCLELISIPAGTLLHEPRQPLQWAYFFESGVTSLIAHMSKGRQTEVALIGWEGMSPIALVQGDDQTPFTTIVQMDATAWRIAKADLEACLDASLFLRNLLTRYARALWIQSCYTSLANSQSRIEDRLARWLLMIHDRVEGDRFRITHDFMAVMLGVRRPGVTMALHALEGKGLIRSLRGEVVIRNRSGLVQMADGAYSLAEMEYARVTGLSADKPLAEPAAN